MGSLQVVYKGAVSCQRSTVSDQPSAGRVNNSAGIGLSSQKIAALWNAENPGNLKVIDEECRLWAC